MATQAQIPPFLLYLDKFNNKAFHLYVRSFWAGKFVQLQDSIPEEVRQEAIELLSRWTTTLSKGVSRLVLNKIDYFGQIQDTQFLKGEYLNWDKFKIDKILRIGMKTFRIIGNNITKKLM